MSNDLSDDAQNKNFSGFYELSSPQLSVLACLYGLISILSVSGNILFLAAIYRNKSLQTVTNAFLINRACADMVIGLGSVPFQYPAIVLQTWIFPDFFCRVSPFAKTLSVNVSIFSMTAISIDRYMAYAHPLRHILLTRSLVRVILVTIWVVAILVAIPELLVYAVDADGKCLVTEIFAHLWYQYYTFALTWFQYFIPLSVISVAYIIAILKIRWAKTPGHSISSQNEKIQENKRKVIRILIAVVMLFLISWLPLQLYYVISYFNQNINEYYYINLIYLGSNWLAMSNCCQNPIMYALIHDRFKRAYKQLLCCKKVSQNGELTVTLTHETSIGYVHDDIKRTPRPQRQMPQRQRLLMGSESTNVDTQTLSDSTDTMPPLHRLVPYRPPTNADGLCDAEFQC